MSGWRHGRTFPGVLIGICLLTLSCGNPFACLTIWHRFPDFHRASLSERKKLIKQYSIEDQVELYHLSMECYHPPDVTLSYPIAEKNGEKVLPVIANILEESEDEYRIFDTIDILQDLSCYFYRIDDNDRVLKLLEARIRTMKDSDLKRMATEDLGEIRGRVCPSDAPYGSSETPSPP